MNGWMTYMFATGQTPSKQEYDAYLRNKRAAKRMRRLARKGKISTAKKVEIKVKVSDEDAKKLRKMLKH